MRLSRITLLFTVTLYVVSISTGISGTVFAQSTPTTVQINASNIVPKTEITISPSSGTFTQGSTFEVPIYLNTKGSTIGTIELHMSFDPNVLNVVKPSGGSSIIGLWVAAPSYDNTKGIISFIGGIPRGITTSSGLIATITFEAKRVGTSEVSLRNTSRILLSDGVGSPAQYESNRARYTITITPPSGAIVSSETHPFRDHWYNNNNPSFTWNQESGVSGYSTAYDNKPNTIPENVTKTTNTIQSYENVGDGTWYFHVKAMKNGAWGATTHYEIKIDTEPPADFRPQINYITAAVIDRALISFFTPDALSGIDHYEVGVIDKSKPATESPAFFRTESPYQIPFDTIDNSRVIVRAFDRAGNVRDSSIDVHTPFLPAQFIKNHAVAILLSIILLLIAIGLIYYFHRHYKYV